MFVCMGNASTTDTEAWVTQAKLHQATAVSTVSGRPRPVSAIIVSSRRPPSGRPISAVSAGASRRSDSGVFSPAKSSGYGSVLDVTTHYSNSIATLDEDTDEEGSTENYPKFDSKPYMPRPSDTVCLLADNVNGGSRLTAVYATPIPQTKVSNEGCIEEADSVFSDVSQLTSETSQDDDLQVEMGSQDGTTSQMDETENRFVFHDIDELGTVIVGTVLKFAMAQVTGQDVDKITQSSEILQQLLPDDKYKTLTTDLLGNVTLVPRVEEQKVKKKKSVSLPGGSGSTKTTPGGSGITKIPHPPGTPKEAFKEKLPPPKLTLDVEKEDVTQHINNDRDSDDDSLLNSDEDYEQGRDEFFRKKKKKIYALTNKKGLEQFKQFLVGTLGERNWNFWLDVERTKLLKDKEEKLK